MKITELFPETIELEYEDEVWKQPIDYEHIPFRCRRCHEVGHIYKECHVINATNEVHTRAQEHVDTQTQEFIGISTSRETTSTQSRA